jgi:hypothetical protein
LIIALIWLLTVAGASTLTWGVISSAGTRVGQPAPLTAGVTTSPAPASTPSPVPSRSAEPGHSVTPSNKPTGSKPTGSKPTNTATASPVTITGTWSEDPGKVTASCTGTVIALIAVVPTLGYKAQVGKDGTKALTVEFEQTDSHTEEGETHLSISCEDGKPVFRHD